MSLYRFLVITDSAWNFDVFTVKSPRVTLKKKKRKKEKKEKEKEKEKKHSKGFY